MTQCTDTRQTVATRGRRALQAGCGGGALTSDAGALRLREADRRLGLLDTLDHCLPDPHDPDRLAHPQRALLAQRVFGIAGLRGCQ